MNERYGTMHDPGHSGRSSGGAEGVVVVGRRVVVWGLGRGLSVAEPLVLSQQILPR